MRGGTAVSGAVRAIQAVDVCAGSEERRPREVGLHYAVEHALLVEHVVDVGVVVVVDPHEPGADLAGSVDRRRNVGDKSSAVPRPGGRLDIAALRLSRHLADDVDGAAWRACAGEEFRSALQHLHPVDHRRIERDGVAVADSDGRRHAVELNLELIAPREILIRTYVPLVLDIDAGRELQDLLHVGEVEVLDQLLGGHHHRLRNFAWWQIELGGDAGLAHRVGDGAALLCRERAERRDRQILRRLEGRCGECAGACGARLGLRHSLLCGVRVDDDGGKLGGIGVWRRLLAGSRRCGFRERRGLTGWRFSLRCGRVRVRRRRAIGCRLGRSGRPSSRWSRGLCFERRRFRRLCESCRGRKTDADDR